MPVSGGEVVVSILANTSQFTEKIAQTEAEMAGLGAITRTGWGTDALLKRSGLDKTIAEVRGMKDESIKLGERLKTVDTEGSKHLDHLHAHARRTHFGFLGISSGTIVGGAGLVVAAQAFHHIQEHLEVTGDKAFSTAGRIRNAFSSLLVGDVVGAIGAFDVQKVDGTIEELQKMLNKGNKSPLKVGLVTHDLDIVARVFGTDRARQRQLKRLQNVSLQYAAAVEQAIATALHPTEAVDKGSALVFGERGAETHDPNVVGATLGRGAFTPPESGATNIHVHGVTDPKTVAHHVAAHLTKNKKSNPKRRRGRVYNGLH